MTWGGSHVSPENIQAMEQILIILSGRQGPELNMYLA